MAKIYVALIRKNSSEIKLKSCWRKMQKMATNFSCPVSNTDGKTWHSRVVAAI